VEKRRGGAGAEAGAGARARAAGSLPSFEESVLGGSLVVTPPGLPTLNVMGQAAVGEAKGAGAAVVGSVAGEVPLLVAKASRFLGDDGTLVDFTLNFRPSPMVPDGKVPQ